MKLQVLKAPSLSSKVIRPPEIELPLSEQPNSCLVIGRFQKNNSASSAKRLSQRHIQVIVRQSELLVRNLNHLNGTLHNRRYPLPTHNWTRVKPGDTLQLGTTHLRVALSSASSKKASGTKANPYVFLEKSEMAFLPEEPVSVKPFSNQARPGSLKQEKNQENKIVSKGTNQELSNNTHREPDAIHLQKDFKEALPPSVELKLAKIEIDALLQKTEIDFQRVSRWLFDHPYRDNLAVNQKLVPAKLVVSGGSVEPLRPTKEPSTQLDLPTVTPEPQPVSILEPAKEQAQTAQPGPMLENSGANSSVTLEIPPTTPSVGTRIERQIRSSLMARPIFWIYLFLIGLAELLTALSVVQIGLPLHAFLLVMLLVQSATDPDKSRRQLALALSLAPLIRLLSLSLPLLNFNQLIWYPLVAIPLLVTCWLIIQYTGLRWKELGLSWGKVPVQLMFSLGGVGLGVIEYTILQPRPLFGVINWEILIIGGLNLLFFTGFNEEIIFRGVLQKLAEPVLKDKALLFLALLFAVLHMGYLSILDLLFVFAVGFVFAYIVRWGGSLLGVIIAHGLTNTTMFLVMPYTAQYPQDPLSQLVPWVVGLTTLLSGIGLVRLAWQGGFFNQIRPPRLLHSEIRFLKDKA